MARVRNQADSSLRLGCGGAIVIIIGLIVYAKFIEQPDSPAAHVPISAQESVAVEAPSCVLQWRLCKDNADMANNNKEAHSAAFRCETEADKHVKFGEAKWSWTPFSTFQIGDDYVKTGLVIKIDKRVQFQNQFGAWAHMRATCVYDIVKHEVKSVDIEEED
jgi:hypothetical protein